MHSSMICVSASSWLMLYHRPFRLVRSALTSSRTFVVDESNLAVLDDEDSCERKREVFGEAGAVCP